MCSVEETKNKMTKKMPRYYSSSDSDGEPVHSAKLFGGRGTLHQLLGKGLVGDILLWKNKQLSAALVIGASVIWFLFEVAEYQFVTLVCHVILGLMSILCFWSSMAGLIQIEPPSKHQLQISESACRYLFVKFNRFLMKIYDISSGKNWPKFFGTITFLWILSAVGNYFSTLNLMYFAFLGLITLPALYERYEHEVDYFAGKGSRNAKKLYKKFDSKVLDKIPRGPVKQKKFT